MSFGLALTPFGEWVEGLIIHDRLAPVLALPPGLLADNPEVQRISAVPQGMLAEFYVFPDYPSHVAVVQLGDMAGTTKEREALARRKIEENFAEVS